MSGTLWLDLATYLGVVAGVLVSLGLIWQKGIRPVYKFFVKIEEVHDIITNLPEWQEAVDHMLREIQGHIDNTSVHTGS